MSTDEWISALESGWRQRDPNAIAGLFTDDAYYHRGPFGEPHRGRDAIRAHWVEILSRQVDPRIWFGSAIESAGRAAVEFWCVLHDPATRDPRTASGCLTLRFGSDGRCSVLHEYWHAELNVAIDPAEDWFSPRAEGRSATNSSRIPG
jgi:hypothetical protein